MTIFEKEVVEHTLLLLDESMCLFPQFKLTNENNQLKLLGHGGFSSVYEMYNREHPEQKVALKISGFERHTVSSEQFWNTGRMQWILCQESPYIVRMLEAKELMLIFDESGNVIEVRTAKDESWKDDENSLRLQIVLMEKLEKILMKDRFQKVSLLKEELAKETEVIKFALEIGQALHIVHVSSVLHRDIKLENIFWDAEEEVYKLGDFGTAKYAENGKAETIIYTDGYGAPEIERRLYDCYNVTADIYSFGITLYLLLNDLKFPGSDGYSPKVEVQYNPEYIFPAPVYASVEMTRVIRKMCSYDAQHRYQSVAELLTDLVMLSKKEQIALSDDLMDMVDMATETYREEKKQETLDNTSENHQKSRLERKEEQRRANALYRKESIQYYVRITILFILVLKGFSIEKDILSNTLFCLVLILVLFEAILQKLKEFHVGFGVIAMGAIGISMYQLGVTIPHIILLWAVLVGYPLLTLASVTSISLWLILEQTSTLPVLDKIETYHLGWLFLGILVLTVYKYFRIRIEWKR